MSEHTRMPVVRDNIEELCRVWPESAYYLGLLLSYIKDLRHGEPEQIRVLYYSSDAADTTTGNSCRESSLAAPTAPAATTTPSATTTLAAITTSAATTTDLRPHASVVVVEGHLSPKTVIDLSFKYNMRPEFLLGHLELERVMNLSRTSYELPALPSRRRNIVHVRLASVWRSDPSEDLYPGHVNPQERAQANLECREYEKGLFSRRAFGETRFRRVHLHSSKYFVVEQVVSFCVAEDSFRDGGAAAKEGSWNCIYLIDSGNPLPFNGLNHWNGPHTSLWDAPERLHAVRYNEPYSLKERKPGPENPPPDGYFRMHPYHPIAEFWGHRQCRLVGEDAGFFGLASLLATASASWNQVLNFLEDDITTNQGVPTEETPAALAQIRFDLGLIQRFNGFIQVELETLQDELWKPVPRRPVSPQSGSVLGENVGDLLEEEQHVMYRDLERDYVSLIQRSALLSGRCESASNLLDSAIAQVEAQRSTKQTAELNKLTKLAFVFVPLSFVASVFGMNVSEINPGSAPSVWTYFVVASTALFVSVSVSFGAATSARLFSCARSVLRSYSQRQR